MRYADAVERQKLALAEARAGVVRSHAEVRQREARLEIVSANLEKQRVHLESFHHFLKAQESIFFHKHDEDSSADFDATAATAASSSAAIFSQSSVSSQGAKGTEAGENIEARGFVPSFEWQNIPRGVSIPAGLEIRLNLSSGAEERAAEDVGQSSSPSSRMARIPLAGTVDSGAKMSLSEQERTRRKRSIAAVMRRMAQRWDALHESILHVQARSAIS